MIPTFPLTVACVLAASATAVGVARPDSFTAKGHRGLIVFAGFSADSKVLITIDESSLVQRWDARTGKLLSTRTDPSLTLEHPRLNQEDAGRFAPARSFAVDGSAVARLTKAGTVWVRDLGTGKERELRADAGEKLHGVALSPDGRQVATTAARGDRRPVFTRLQFWDAATGKLLRSSDAPQAVGGLPPGEPPIKMAFTPDGKTLVTAEFGTRFWDVATARPRALAPSTPLTMMWSFAPDGRAVAVSVRPFVLGPWGLDSAPVEVFDTATGKLVVKLKVKGAGTGIGWYLPDGQTFATLHPQEKSKPYTQLWDTRSWKETVRLDGVFVAASPDGKVVLTEPEGWRLDQAAPDRTLTAWDARTGKKLRVLPRDLAPSVFPLFPSEVVFSPDDSRLAIMQSNRSGAGEPVLNVRVIATAGLWGP